ncbi:DegV family EDD domain-containing protein [Desulfocapsa sp. AH-315-G09]|nr:DegV family EDD domain-containing protein [Desulfocapsa sp.]MBN4065508.1 DegV family EDD domain-containing protein [Desulfocapsa sp. AH-315-G09]
MKNSISSPQIAAAAIAGYENLTAWADLLDRINVFPVADGDTGMNLRVSLAPLRECGTNLEAAIAQLALTGRGNSGNIAVAFFREFLHPMENGFAGAAQKGREQAWKAIGNPSHGTMLEVFDVLCLLFLEEREAALDYVTVRDHMQKAVLSTEKQLSELSDAGVVDAGALGMFCFFDGFFGELTGQKAAICPVTELFANTLCINASFRPPDSEEYCVEARLATDGDQGELLGTIANLGNSVVVVPGDSCVKVHIHTRSPEQLRDKLSLLGNVRDWSDEAMGSMIGEGTRKSFVQNRVRIMSDAAGSIPLELARIYGIILLDSYILTHDLAKPESLFSPEQLYILMKNGTRVTTAQASTHERHLHYQAGLHQYEKVLYLCTGSAFTGNFSIAVDWQKENDSDTQFAVIDTGAASGRLGVIALLTARHAETGASAEDVKEYAEKLTRQAEEYVFIHELKHLVAGGRVSKAKGFFGDLLHMKPVISPGFEGVRKIAVVRTREGQLDFACARIEHHADASLFVLLQYTDNKDWLREVVEPQIRRHVPEAEILLVPLSLTSGVHMGPGAWSIAFAACAEAA